MRVFAVLALLLGFMTQMLLDGQVFTHAVFGIVCGIIAIGCGLASARRQRLYRWEGWILAALGFAFGVWCVVVLPSAYRQQESFNNRHRAPTDNSDKYKMTPGKTP